MMTKLLEWLLVISIYATFYISALTNLLPLNVTERGRLIVLLSPVILVGLFGIYSVVTILYRVSTFNDCPDAAAELKQQIVEAKKDLTSKGMKFD